VGKRINSFRELIVYQKAFELQQDIFKLTKTLPKEEVYSLTDQIRRSSRSIGANIAEAWHKRRYRPHFVSKLSDADAEQAETRHWLGTSLKCQYITEEECQSLLKKCEEIGKILGRMMNRPEKFCVKE
jgi:four helix bundle protein